MDNIIEKFEIANIDKFIKYLSYNSFMKILLDKVKDSFILSFNNTNEEYNFKVETKPDPLALENLRTREFILSQKTIENLRGNLRYELLSGMEANESIDMITRRVSKIFVSNSVNIERICRTEVLHSLNSGRMEAYRSSKVVKYKMVIGANDKRLCALCRRMRGQIKPISEPFQDPKNLDESWMHPPFHPSGRCSTVPLRKLPDNIIRVSGQMYAADKKLGKVEINTDLFKSQQKRKAWVVQWSDGRAVTCFENESDADYYITTSKKKDAGWFAFVSKKYREVKSGWSINKKGTKITFKTDGESRKVNKVELNTELLNKTEKRIWIKATSKRKGHYRRIKVKTSEETKASEKTAEKESVPMTPENLEKLTSFKDLGMMGGLHEPESYKAEFKDNTNAMYKVMKKGCIVGEISTYDVSKILNWDVVPETTDGNFKGKGNGSCQRWIKGENPYEGYDNNDKLIEEKHFDDLSKIYVMDMVAGNYDRHGSNVVIDENDHCWAIDNEDWGTAGAADDFMTALDDRAGISDVGGFSPMVRWLDKNFDEKQYSVFRDKVVNNMKYVADNKDKVINYYNKYKDDDFTVGADADKKSITLILLCIKQNLDYIEKYCGENK